MLLAPLAAPKLRWTLPAGRSWTSAVRVRGARTHYRRIVTIDPWLLGRIACPWDHAPLEAAGNVLRCPHGHEMRVVDGIPILLRDDVHHPHGAAVRSLQAEEGQTRAPATAPPSGVDSYVQHAVAATNGIMYKELIGKLTDYPIPELRLPRGEGRTFLDIGCNWGRWCVAAGRLGYRPVGLDPNLDAVRAARRVSRQLGVEAHFVVGDARYLPFVGESFDVVYSYSVLQHLAKEYVAMALVETRRVLAPGGQAVVQMPNTYGLRCLYHQARRGFRDARDFEVRYWTPSELRSRFQELIGDADLSVDGFFSINPQPAEAHLLPFRYRMVVRTSVALRAVSSRVPALSYGADSLIVRAVKDARAQPPNAA